MNEGTENAGLYDFPCRRARKLKEWWQQYRKFVEEIRDIEADIVGRQKSLQAELREMGHSGMSDYNADWKPLLSANPLMALPNRYFLTEWTNCTCSKMIAWNII